MHPLARDVLQEVAPDHALAHQAALDVGEDRQHGVDLVPPDEGFQLLEVEIAGHGSLGTPTRAPGPATGRLAGLRR